MQLLRAKFYLLKLCMLQTYYFSCWYELLLCLRPVDPVYPVDPETFAVTGIVNNEPQNQFMDMFTSFLLIQKIVSYSCYNPVDIQKSLSCHLDIQHTSSTP